MLSIDTLFSKYTQFVLCFGKIFRFHIASGTVIWDWDVHIFYREGNEVGLLTLFLNDSCYFENMRGVVSETADGRKLHCTERHFWF